MGHANLTNLSEIYINLLYAKGKLSIRDAIEAAVRRHETLHASEGEYDDDGTLGMGFMDIVAFLSSEDGRDYSGGDGPWPGPFIVPDWVSWKPPRGVRLGSTATAMTRRIRGILETHINLSWEERELFRVAADAIQDEGHEVWAERLRRHPGEYQAYALWKCDSDEYHDGDHWEAFDCIPWRFTPGWRNRYRDVPRLGHVTH